MEEKYINIIEWLELYYKPKKINTYRAFEDSPEFIKDFEKAKKDGIEFLIDPFLPIDLLSVDTIEVDTDVTSVNGNFIERKRKINSYTLHWIILKEDKNLEKKLKFYRFYLSRITKLIGVNIIIVTITKINTNLRNDLIKLNEVNGFGFFELDIDKKKLIKNIKSKNYSEFITENFLNPPEEGYKEFKKIIDDNVVIKDNAIGIVLFFEKFIRESIEGMVGVTKEQIGKRIIERKILDFVFELKNLKYREDLQKLVTEHLISKDDDFIFVEKVFNQLWEKYIFGMKYSQFLKTFEPPLFNIFSDNFNKKHYRDHYLHQFQVFLLGSRIIDEFYDKFSNNNMIDEQWLITSSFHDMSYPLQKYDEWAQKFFKKSLGIEELGVFDLKSHFIEKSLLSNSCHIINLFIKKFLNKNTELKGNWLSDNKPFIDFVYDKITTNKNHCFLSSLVLLKEAEKFKIEKDILNNYFIPSALAIFMHHQDKWHEENEKENFHLKKLSFKDDPLSFLLLLCDAAQEWGRPDNKNNLPIKKEQNFIFDSIEFNRNSCKINLKNKKLTSTHKLFKYKTEELTNLKGFLKHSNKLKFTINLIDKTDETMPFSMIG